MIFVRDKGRLCNNILQYGHVYAWGREHGRKTMSMRFAYKYRWFHICDTPHHNFFTYLFAKYGAKWGLIPVVSFHEEGADTTVQEALMLRRRLVVAEGWQARWYDLFLKYKSEILALFRFHDMVERHVAEVLADSPAATIRLGVHIRRGDYARFYDGKFFYTDGQYAGLIRQFLSLHEGQPVEVYICGNDPRLDKAYYLQELGEVVHFPTGNPAEDLCLLSHCDYLIGPPSTFTLVASMYRDLPLYWVKDATQPLTEASFDRFDHLFRHIL